MTHVGRGLGTCKLLAALKEPLLYTYSLIIRVVEGLLMGLSVSLWCCKPIQQKDTLNNYHTHTHITYDKPLSPCQACSRENRTENHLFWLYLFCTYPHPPAVCSPLPRCGLWASCFTRPAGLFFFFLGRREQSSRMSVVCVCVCVCGVTECPVTNLFFVNRGTIHLLCAMVQRSGHSKCGYRG